MKLVKPILLIETGTALCSVSLAKGTSIITSRSTAEPRAHASVLAPFIDEILKECQITMKDCGAVAISGGPGSYTGLRVGVSTAKGLCFGAGIPLIHVCSLELIAQLYIDKYMHKPPRYICPLIDARRREVYTALFSVKDSVYGNMAFSESPVRSLEIQEDSFSDILEQGTVLFTGDGAAKCKDWIVHDNALFFPMDSHADGMAKAALKAFFSKDFADLAYYVPYYLKEYRVAQPKKGV
ncbi:MAG: tRNA (adenosine(37)-N6)-threonylcarbamoyltransferase complex dimerization subunit type 1 TsaB [Bacteroidales bacterium]|jgi:tRNA threonylcarbamoyladenosine biosynthesis protein TsaB